MGFAERERTGTDEVFREMRERGSSGKMGWRRSDALCFAGAVVTEESLDGEIVSFGGDLRKNLRRESDPDTRSLGDFLEEAIIVSRSLAEAISKEVEGDAGDENEIKVFGENRRVLLRNGFRNSVGADQEGAGVGDEMKGDFFAVENEGVAKVKLRIEGVEKGEVGLVGHGCENRDAACFRVLSGQKFGGVMKEACRA